MVPVAHSGSPVDLYKFMSCYFLHLSYTARHSVVFLSLGLLFHFIPYPNSTHSVGPMSTSSDSSLSPISPPLSSTPLYSVSFTIPKVMTILHLNTFTDKLSFSHEQVHLSFGWYCKFFFFNRTYT